MYGERMSETGQDDSGITRRSFLKKAALGLGALIGVGTLGHRITEPTRNQADAETLWQEFFQDPEGFQKNHPDLVHQNLVAGPDGLNIRSDASAISPENIIARKKPGEPIGTAIQLPASRLHDPDGPWYFNKPDGKDNRTVFFSGKFVEEKQPNFQAPAK